MKSWIKLVWVKRLLPLVLLAGVWGGYRWRQASQNAAELAEAARLAPVVAEVWVGTAEYRHDPARFIVWRDSILKARGVTREQLQTYFHDHPEETERYYGFAQLVSAQVDSITKIQDSIRKLNTKLSPQDSVRADSIARLQKRLESAPAVPLQK
ncbi:MAG: hypothetical protein HY851_01000 [candidate division Zixibacteria bacterium]|nr:hypothetical protein [candidate division Zixibacteria bacterium]